MARCTKLPKTVKDQMILFCKAGTVWRTVNLVSARTHKPSTTASLGRVALGGHLHQLLPLPSSRGHSQKVTEHHKELKKTQPGDAICVTM